MRRCLKPAEIEAYARRAMNGRRAAAVTRHLAACSKCADAVAQERENETWLAELNEARELAELRERIRQKPPTSASGLTAAPGE